MLVPDLMILDLRMPVLETQVTCLMAMVLQAADSAIATEAQLDVLLEFVAVSRRDMGQLP